MAHKDQETIDALVNVTSTMLRLWYSDDCTMTIGELSEAVDRCATIFQFYSPHEGTEIKLFALIDLANRRNIINMRIEKE